MADNLVVDSDTNDPNQQNRASNNDFGVAQQVGAASQVVGYVNKAMAGPAGANHDNGDEVDAFTVTLAAGQIIELDFSGDPSANDLDLYLFQPSGGTQAVVGQSVGTGSNECVRITTSGTYTVAVQAFAGASSYSLRMTTPGVASACSNASTSSASANAIVPGELIVKARKGGDGASRAQAMASQAGMSLSRGSLAAGRHGLMRLPAAATARMQALDGLGGDASRRTAQSTTPRRGLTLDATARLHLDTIAYAKRLRKSGAFQYVMLNRTLQASGQLVGSYPPNDPGYAQQRWHFEQIALPSAMQFVSSYATTPNVRPIVAVVDTGIVADHPDLQGQIADGFDFIKSVDSAGDGDGIDADPNDLTSRSDLPSFHGTHVAGLIAASTFNATGVAGVAPMAQLMPLRVLGKGGSGTLYDIVQALSYASGQDNDSGRHPARRADVANLSLGIRTLSACDADSQAFFDSVRAAGTIVVAAAGNEASRNAGTSADVGFPANCNGVIAVSATDAQRNIAPYSNTGPKVALAAPGGDMTQATTGNGLPDGIYSTLAAFDSAGNRVPTYGQLQGTSMAAPHVAGVIAMMRWIWPDITPAQVDWLMSQGLMTDEAGAAGRDDQYGWGILNARKAVEAAQQLKTGALPAMAAGSVEAQPSTLAFGTATTALEFVLRTTATTGEVVTAVTGPTGVTVNATSADATTGLGTYRVSVDRSALPIGVSTLAVTVQTSLRTFSVSLTVQKLASGSVVAAPDAGPVYVLVLDASTNAVLAQSTPVQAANGRYAWSIPNITAPAIRLMAGTDIDNDGNLCGRGDACGAYPVVGGQLSTITLTGDTSGLDFVLSPTGAVNATSLSAGKAVTSAGVRRLR